MVIRYLFCGSAAQGIKPGVRTNMYLLSKSHVRLFWHFPARFHLTSSYRWSRIIQKWTGEKSQLPCVQIYLLHFDYWVQITSTSNQQISCSMSLEKSLNLADFFGEALSNKQFLFYFYLRCLALHCLCYSTFYGYFVDCVTLCCSQHLDRLLGDFLKFASFTSAVDFSIALNTLVCWDFQINFQFEMTSDKRFPLLNLDLFGALTQLIILS